MVLFIAILLPGRANAASLENMLDLDSLIQELPDSALEHMDGINPGALPSTGISERLISAAVEKGKEEFHAIVRISGIIVTVCVMTAVAGSVESGNQSRFVLLSGVTAIAAAGLSDLNSYLISGTQALHEASDYAKVLLPVLSSAAASAGAVGGAAARYAATSLFISVLLDFSDAILMPCISAFAALSVANAAMGNDVLKSTKKLVKRTCELVLTSVCLAFTAWLGLSGIAADPADALAARTAKTAISTALPVVGGILSDAAGSLAAAAGALRNSIGIFGILAVAFICLKPFAALGVRFLVYRLTSAVCCVVSEKRLVDLVEDLGSCFGLILAINGTGALMLFFSFYSLIRTAI